MLDTKKLQNELIALGANPFLKGFGCTVEALKVIDEKKDERVKLMNLYETVAERCGTKKSEVERAIRYFLKDFRKKPEAIEIIREKGTNGDSLFLLYYKLKGEVECNTES